MSKKLDPKISKQGKKIAYSKALHPKFISELAKVAEVSIRKGYVPFNWISKDSSTRVSTFLEAHARHKELADLGDDINIEKDLEGNTIDIKVHHYVYAAYNLLMAAYLIKHLPEHDDRPFKKKQEIKKVSNPILVDAIGILKDITVTRIPKKKESHKYPESHACKEGACTCLKN